MTVFGYGVFAALGLLLLWSAPLRRLALGLVVLALGAALVILLTPMVLLNAIGNLLTSSF
ncbi:hypothetical protein ACFOD9_12260 [Novosphingobium bradum]|uniref:Uncharacterized protein n=1 Tax=Novosphingobium bradum TaxID=1737444 RepID=A0ABV7IQT2_9SPHN